MRARAPPALAAGPRDSQARSGNQTRQSPQGRFSSGHARGASRLASRQAELAKEIAVRGLPRARCHLLSRTMQFLRVINWIIACNWKPTNNIPMPPQGPERHIPKASPRAIELARGTAPAIGWALDLRAALPEEEPRLAGQTGEGTRQTIGSGVHHFIRTLDLELRTAVRSAASFSLQVATRCMITSSGDSPEPIPIWHHESASPPGLKSSEFSEFILIG